MNADNRITASLSKVSFLQIIGGSGITFFGGHQQWFDRFTQSFGGCGPIAAANILAYMATNNSELSKLYGYNSEHISQEDFSEFMREIYQYVTPREIPIWNIYSDKKASRVGIPSLGITNVDKFVAGVEKYALSKGIIIKTNRFNEKLTLDNAVNYIKKGLDKDCPIALLNMFHKVDMQWKCPLTGVVKPRVLKRHWVTITGMTENKLTGEVTLEVSTWGGKATLCLNDLMELDWKSTFFSQGMVYFEFISTCSAELKAQTLSD